MEIVGRLTLVINKYAVTNKCINFKTKEQEDLLISQFPHRDFDSNIFMQDGDAILVPLNYEECIKYNYCYFNNRINDTEKKRYFCYITGYTYVEPNVTRINVAVDTLQTFFFDIDKLRGNLERCHSARRINVGTEETPRYIINPDLYFMEDEVSEDYKATSTQYGSFVDDQYICYVFKIPLNLNGRNYVSTPERVLGTIDNTGLYVDVALDGENYTKDGVVYDGVSYIKFNNTSVPVGNTAYTGTPTFVETYGDTGVVSILVKLDNEIAKPQTLFRLFKNLGDKLINTFIINYSGGYFNTSGIQLNSLGDAEPKHLYINTYVVNNVKSLFKRKIVSVNAGSDLDVNTWAYDNDDQLIVRKMSQEKKLNLYPYSYAETKLMCNKLTWKYQENYKLLTAESDITPLVYSFVHWVDITNTTPSHNGSYLYSIDNNINVDETTINDLFDENTRDVDLLYYFKSSDMGGQLPTLPVYLSQYTSYENYKKAIVDANNTINTLGAVSGVVQGSASIKSPRASFRYNDPKSSYGYKQKAVHYKSGNRIKKLYNQQYWSGHGTSTYHTGSSEVYGGFGSLGNVVGAVGNYITTALNENALKIQPYTSVVGLQPNDELFTSFGGTSETGSYEYVLTRFELQDNIKSIHEQKFYNYGYAIPVDVELTKADLMNIINNRKYFCYMEWNSLEIESYIPTIYMNDIVARLTNGVRFENTSDTLLFPTYDMSSNNKETSIPVKPFFVRNY